MGPSVIGIGGVWFIEAWLGGIATGDLFRPVGVQPLATKCRVEPTGGWRGQSNSRFTASSNGTIELETELSERWCGVLMDNMPS